MTAVVPNLCGFMAGLGGKGQLGRTSGELARICVHAQLNLASMNMCVRMHAGPLLVWVELHACAHWPAARRVELRMLVHTGPPLTQPHFEQAVA